LTHSEEVNLADIWADRNRYGAISTVSIDLGYRSLPYFGLNSVTVNHTSPIP